MAETKSAMRKPVFTKVDQLRPGTNGHNLVVKVVSAKTVLRKGRPDGPQVNQMRIAECLVGDETGTILFTARNEQGMILHIYVCEIVLDMLLFLSSFNYKLQLAMSIEERFCFWRLCYLWNNTRKLWFLFSFYLNEKKAEILFKVGLMIWLNLMPLCLFDYVMYV